MSKIINENPEEVQLEKYGVLSKDDSDSFSFGYKQNEDGTLSLVIDSDDETLVLTGQFWIDSAVISLWDVDLNEKDFNSVLKDISNLTGITNWFVDRWA